MGIVSSFIRKIDNSKTKIKSQPATQKPKIKFSTGCGSCKKNKI